MGTILSNPYELNFAQTARNAETIEKRVETFTSGNTKYDVIDNLSLACNSVHDETIYVMKITTIDTQAIKYRVSSTTDGRNPIDSNTAQKIGEYSTTSEANSARADYIEKMNDFRVEDGCGDSSAINYSPVSPSSRCPCKTSNPVWEFNKSWNETPILQTVAETQGDCSCIYAPTYTEGGYIVEQWTYKGQPTNEYDTNPPYAKILHKWEWEEKAGKSDIPQPDKSDNEGRIAKAGYRATGLTTQEYIVKPSLMPTTWKKYRITTATGFQQIGCKDSTAQNYVEGSVAEDPDNPCEYCYDSDTHSEYDPEAGKCVCKAGYKRGILGTFGKCVKDKQAKTTPSPDPTPEKSFTATGLVAGIVGLTAVGIVVSTAISAKNRGINDE